VTRIGFRHLCLIPLHERGPLRGALGTLGQLHDFPARRQEWKPDVVPVPRRELFLRNSARGKAHSSDTYALSFDSRSAKPYNTGNQLTSLALMSDVAISTDGSLRRLSLPDSRIWRIGTNLPAEPIEANSLQGLQINALEATRVDHIVRGVSARTIKRRHAAVAAEVMECPTGAELIRRQGLISLNETKSIWRYHVMEVTLAPANRAIAFAHPRQLGANLELNPAAMAGASIGLHILRGRHASED